MSLNDLGYVRVAACAPEVVIGDPEANTDHMIAELRKAARNQVAVVLFPELSLTGYTCEDLFFLPRACTAPARPRSRGWSRPQKTSQQLLACPGKPPMADCSTVRWLQATARSVVLYQN